MKNHSVKRFRPCCTCDRKAIGSVLIVMADDRPLPDDASNVERSEENLPSHAMAVAINQRYAMRHGYDFVYYRPNFTPCRSIEMYGKGCKTKLSLYHPQWRLPRAMPWLKLLAAWHGLVQGYDWVVSIDSDAVFRNHVLGIERLLSVMSDEQGASKDILTLSDMPYNYFRDCTGFFVVRGGAHGLSMVKRWWDFLGNGRFVKLSFKHPYEQGAFEALAMPSGPVQGVILAKEPNPMFDDLFAQRCVRVEVSQFHTRRWIPRARNDSLIMHVDHNVVEYRNAIFRFIMQDVDASMQELAEVSHSITVSLDTKAVAKEIAAWEAPEACSAEIAFRDGLNASFIAPQRTSWR